MSKKNHKWVAFESLNIEKTYTSQMYREYSVLGRHITTDTNELDYLIRNSELSLKRLELMDNSEHPIREGLNISITEYKLQMMNEYKFKRKMYIANLSNLFFGVN